MIRRTTWLQTSPMLFSCAIPLLILFNSVHPVFGQCELTKLTASDGAQYDSFGAAVSVSGDVIVVGAREHNDAGSDSGSAYVYRFDGIVWEQEAELLPSDGDEYDIFGGSGAAPPPAPNESHAVLMRHSDIVSL